MKHRFYDFECLIVIFTILHEDFLHCTLFKVLASVKTVQLSRKYLHSR